MQFLALLGGSLGKIAFDIMLMSATEFGEAAEPFVAGRGSSSTMPQKRNPISCELILAAAKALRQHAGLVLDAMVSDFERATGPWHVEWIALPESFGYAAGALHQADFMLGGLIVDPSRMAEEPRHDAWADCRRGGDDGPRARIPAATRRTTSSTTPAAPRSRATGRFMTYCSKPRRSPARSAPRSCAR